MGSLLYWKEWLTISDTEGIKTSILQNKHDSTVAGHFGSDKAIEQVQRNFYWLYMFHRCVGGFPWLAYILCSMCGEDFVLDKYNMYTSTAICIMAG